MDALDSPIFPRQRASLHSRHPKPTPATHGFGSEAILLADLEAAPVQVMAAAPHDPGTTRPQPAAHRCRALTDQAGHRSIAAQPRAASRSACTGGAWTAGPRSTGAAGRAGAAADHAQACAEPARWRRGALPGSFGLAVPVWALIGSFTHGRRLVPPPGVM